MVYFQRRQGLQAAGVSRELWLKFGASTGLMSCTTFIRFNTGTETNSFTSGTNSILLKAVTLHEEQTKGHCEAVEIICSTRRRWLQTGTRLPTTVSDHERPGGHHVVP